MNINYGSLFIALVIIVFPVFLSIVLRREKRRKDLIIQQLLSTKANKIDERKFEVENYKSLPYVKKQFFFTKREYAFYNDLCPIISKHNLVLFSKVRLLDILTIPQYTKGYQTYFNKIRSKHVDFVICSSKYITPLLAIELDDPSHNEPDRIIRDYYIDSAMNSAKIPIMHIYNWSKESLENDILIKLPKQ